MPGEPPVIKDVLTNKIEVQFSFSSKVTQCTLLSSTRKGHILSCVVQLQLLSASLRPSAADRAAAAAMKLMSEDTTFEQLGDLLSLDLISPTLTMRLPGSALLYPHPKYKTKRSKQKSGQDWPMSTYITWDNVENADFDEEENRKRRETSEQEKPSKVQVTESEIPESPGKDAKRPVKKFKIPLNKSPTPTRDKKAKTTPPTQPQPLTRQDEPIPGTSKDGYKQTAKKSHKKSKRSIEDDLF